MPISSNNIIRTDRPVNGNSNQAELYGHIIDCITGTYTGVNGNPLNRFKSLDWGTLESIKQNSPNAKFIIAIDDSGSMTEDLVDTNGNPNSAIQLLRNQLDSVGINYAVVKGCATERWLQWAEYFIQNADTIQDGDIQFCDGCNVNFYNDVDGCVVKLSINGHSTHEGFSSEKICAPDSNPVESWLIDPMLSSDMCPTYKYNPLGSVNRYTKLVYLTPTPPSTCDYYVVENNVTLKCYKGAYVVDVESYVSWSDSCFCAHRWNNVEVPLNAYGYPNGTIILEYPDEVTPNPCTCGDGLSVGSIRPFDGTKLHIEFEYTGTYLGPPNPCPSCDSTTTSTSTSTTQPPSPPIVGAIYAGTENGLFYSINNGDTWDRIIDTNPIFIDFVDFDTWPSYKILTSNYINGECDWTRLDSGYYAAGGIASSNGLIVMPYTGVVRYNYPDAIANMNTGQLPTNNVFCIDGNVIGTDLGITVLNSLPPHLDLINNHFYVYNPLVGYVPLPPGTDPINGIKPGTDPPRTYGSYSEGVMKLWVQAPISNNLQPIAFGVTGSGGLIKMWLLTGVYIWVRNSMLELKEDWGEVRDVHGDGDAVCVATSNGIQLSNDRGNTWKKILDISIRCVKVYNNGQTILAGHSENFSGGLFISRNGGFTFSEYLIGEKTNAVLLSRPVEFITCGPMYDRCENGTCICSKDYAITQYSQYINTKFIVLRFKNLASCSVEVVPAYCYNCVQNFALCFEKCDLNPYDNSYLPSNVWCNGNPLECFNEEIECYIGTCYNGYIRKTDDMLWQEDVWYIMENPSFNATTTTTSTTTTSTTPPPCNLSSAIFDACGGFVDNVVHRACILDADICLVSCEQVPLCQDCIFLENCGENGGWYPGNGDYCYSVYNDCIKITCGPVETGCLYVRNTI